MKEIWKLIKDNSYSGIYSSSCQRRTGKIEYYHEQKYYVSNLGRCRKNDKIISFKNTKDSYYRFCGNRVHVWVAKMFIPNPENKPCIDHIDTNIHNNRVDNLRWCTQKENCNNILTKIHYKEGQLSNGGNSQRTKQQWIDKRDIMMESLKRSQPQRTASIRRRYNKEYNEAHITI